MHPKISSSIVPFFDSTTALHHQPQDPPSILSKNFNRQHTSSAPFENRFHQFKVSALHPTHKSIETQDPKPHQQQSTMRPLILLTTYLFTNLAATATWNFDLRSGHNNCKLKIDGICGCHATVTVDSRNRCERMASNALFTDGACGRGTWYVDTHDNKYEFRFKDGRGCDVKCSPRGGGSCEPAL
ncbi:MAG: hypothetical protein Q9168_005743 [Polycauliona sp. 1 TL-2023]